MREQAKLWWEWAFRDNWPRRHYQPIVKEQLRGLIYTLRILKDHTKPVLGLGIRQ